MTKAAWCLVVGACFAACVEQPPERRSAPPGVSQAEMDAIRSRVASNTAPNPQHRLDVNFGDKVTLVGYDISPENPRPGANVTVTWYWRVDNAPGDGWKLFTHCDNAERAVENHDGDGDVRRGYQPEKWRKGEFVTDRQSWDIPEGWGAPVMKVHVGLWRADERMRVVRGQTSPDGRALALTLNFGGAGANNQPPAPPPLSTLRILHAGGPITIDGEFNEPSWTTAATTGQFVNTMNGAPASAGEAIGNLRALWDEQNLYLAWSVRDDDLQETGTARDAHMWEKDCVEALIDPNGDGKDYYELQVSPGNHIFDTQQAQPPAGGSFGNVAWNANLRSAVVANGTVGTSGDADTGYRVEMAIPWSDINAGAAHVPPQVGDIWRANFFVMDRNANGQKAAGWSPPRAPSFHTTDRFGRLVFVPAPPPPGDGGVAVGDGGLPINFRMPPGVVAPQVPPGVVPPRAGAQPAPAH